jgi:hypothetical protein
MGRATRKEEGSTPEWGERFIDVEERPVPGWPHSRHKTAVGVLFLNRTGR